MNRPGPARYDVGDTPWSPLAGRRPELSERFWIEHDAKLAQERRLGDGAPLLLALGCAAASLALFAAAWWWL